MAATYQPQAIRPDHSRRSRGGRFPVRVHGRHRRRRRGRRSWPLQRMSARRCWTSRPAASTEPQIRIAGQPVAFLAGGFRVRVVSRIVRLPAAAHSVAATRRPPLRQSDQPFDAVGLIADGELRIRGAPGACHRSDRGIVAAAGPRRGRRLRTRSPSRIRARCCRPSLPRSSGGTSCRLPSETDRHFGISRARRRADRCRSSPECTTWPTDDPLQHRERDGGRVWSVDPIYCSAVVLVGGPMQRKLLGGDYVGPARLRHPACGRGGQRW